MLENNNDKGIKKILIDDTQNPFAALNQGLPPDAAALLSSMQQVVSTAGMPSEAMELLSKMQGLTQTVDKSTISNTSPGIKHDVQVEINNGQPQDLIRTVPEEIRKARELQEILEKIKLSNEREKFTIYEQGIAFGIIIGKSNKIDVNKIMKDISKIEYQDDDNELIAFYNDIHVTVLFNDDMIVREIQFGNKYRGATTKGLRSGDHIDSAIELYGQPKMKSVRGALWPKFGVFCENNFITSIRLMS
ncbi:MAG: hypothetical protein U0354_08345 [Candidatus Sericytochromatia bacterium]